MRLHLRAIVNKLARLPADAGYWNNLRLDFFRSVKRRIGKPVLVQCKHSPRPRRSSERRQSDRLFLPFGDYKLAQVWYERALKADPNHVLARQYYGLWQIEQGNRDQAVYHLSRIAAICGTDCAEYRSLAAALEQLPGTGLVYRVRAAVRRVWMVGSSCAA